VVFGGVPAPHPVQEVQVIVKLLESLFAKILEAQLLNVGQKAVGFGWQSQMFVGACFFAVCDKEVSFFIVSVCFTLSQLITTIVATVIIRTTIELSTIGFFFILFYF
jgi:hypothetical protein